MNESLTIKMTEYIQTHTRAYKDITKSENIIKITEGGQNIFLVHAGNGKPHVILN